MLGVLAVLLGMLVIGGLLGGVGLVLAAVHLRRSDARKNMARAGLVLSLLGMLLAGAVLIEDALASKARLENAEKRFDRWIGVKVPDITLTTMDGKKIALGSLKGKRVVLDFWATWCSPCVKEIPHFIALQEQASPDELVIIGISNEDEETLRSFFTKKGVNYLIAANAAALPPPFSVIETLPATYFIDRNGVIQQAIFGYHGLDEIKRHALAKDHEGDPRPAPAE